MLGDRQLQCHSTPGVPAITSESQNSWLPGLRQARVRNPLRHRWYLTCLAVGVPWCGLDAASIRWRAAKSLPPRLQLQTVRTDFVPHVTIEFPAKDGRNFTVALRRD